MSMTVFVFIHSAALMHVDKSQSQKIFILHEKFWFSLHYTVKKKRSRNLDNCTVLSVFLLTVFAINGMHDGRKFANTLLVVFCKWDTSFTKLILKNGLSTTALSKFWMLQTSKTLMSNCLVSKVQLGSFLLCVWISQIPKQILPRWFHQQIS